MRASVLTLSFLAATAPALAQESFPHGRIRYVESGVTLQRATETAAEEAVANLPLLPGDRIWTDHGGRAEFQFGGDLLRLDRRSKLDYVAHDEAREDRVVLRLWSGALSLRLPESGASFEIETPGGLVEARRRGVYRIDTDALETRLSVYEGEASLDSGRRRVEVEAGERTFARRGESPEAPRPFDRAELDGFGRWEGERDEREAWAGDSRRYLPDDLEPYAGEFDRNGSWYHEAEVGYVWRPYVTVGWRPYSSGHWAWTPYGWTWIASEAWGWAPFHYGRWGHSTGLGWYWIPGSLWGPAWVSWAVGPGHVGWCALGRGDRAVVVTDSRPRGYAVPRGTTPSWTYVRRADIGSRDLPRRRVEVDATEVRDFRRVDATRGRPTREFRIVEGEQAVPRNVRTRPSPGDTAPELRVDPATTIPFPVIRRSGREGGAATRSSERSQAPEAARERAPRPPREPEASNPDRSIGPAGEAPRERPPDSARRRESDADHNRHADPSQDVLRQIFRRFSEPRPERGQEQAPARPRRETAAPRNDNPPRPPASAPPPPRTAPPPRSDDDRAVRRPSHKEKDQ